MTELEASLSELARWYGVATEYHDWTGRPTTVAPATLVAVLAPWACRRTPSRTARQRSRRTTAGTGRGRCRRRSSAAATPRPRSGCTSPTATRPHLGPAGGRHRAHRCPAGRQLHSPFDLDGRLVGEATFVLPADLPLGYHRVHLRSGDRETSTPLIITPSWLGMPARLGARRSWGLATQLYSVRSKDSWGMGDLADLTDLAVWAGAARREFCAGQSPARRGTHQADGALALPAHVPALHQPALSAGGGHPGFGSLPKRGRVAKLRDDVQSRARRHDGIDRDAAWAAKRTALKLVYRVPRSAGRSWPSRPTRRGRARHWTTSPPGVRWRRSTAATGGAGRRASSTGQPRGRRVRRPPSARGRLPPLAAVAARRPAGRCAVPGGAHRDGPGHHARPRRRVHPTGADAWALRDLLALGVSAGAPPDEYNQLGQDWSQPPWRPDLLEEVGYQPFRALIEAILRHAGGPDRPHHRPVPVVVDPAGRRAHRGHLRSL